MIKRRKAINGQQDIVWNIHLMLISTPVSQHISVSSNLQNSSTLTMIALLDLSPSTPVTTKPMILSTLSCSSTNSKYCLRQSLSVIPSRSKHREDNSDSKPSVSKHQCVKDSFISYLEAVIQLGMVSLERTIKSVRSLMKIIVRPIDISVQMTVDNSLPSVTFENYQLEISSIQSPIRQV